MNVREGYRRISIVIGIVVGPAWFVYQLVHAHYVWSQGDFAVVLFLAALISVMAWLLMWASAKAIIWVLDGFQTPRKGVTPVALKSPDLP